MVLTEAARSEIHQEIAELKYRLDELQRRVGREPPADELTRGDLHLLTCRVGEERAALQLDAIERVVPMAWLAPLPEAPPWVAGLLNLGGHATPVLDVSARIAHRDRAPDLDDLIVVCSVAGRRVGLIVQAVYDVISTQAVAVQRADGEIPHAPYLRGVVEHHGVTHLVIAISRLIAASDLPEQDE